MNNYLCVMNLTIATVFKTVYHNFFSQATSNFLVMLILAIFRLIFIHINFPANSMTEKEEK